MKQLHPLRQLQGYLNKGILLGQNTLRTTAKGKLIKQRNIILSISELYIIT